jgi:ubiquinone/menaquinone biosynthesis C-methylase UbiE
MPDFTELKQKHRKTWASGDYDQIARGIRAVADHVVRTARLRAGERVLDVACGTGNTALAAEAQFNREVQSRILFEFPCVA